MRRIWDAMAAVVVTVFAVYLLYELLKPYAWLIALGLVLALVGGRIYLYHRRG